MDYVNNIYTIPFHWSLEIFVITAICLVVCLSSIVFLFLKKYPKNLLFLKYVFILPIVVFLMYFVSITPCSLKVDKDSVSIKRVFDSIDIPLKSICIVEAFDQKSFDESIRIIGSGGLFGYLGVFKNKRIGEFSVYATDKTKLILIITDKTKFVISCSEKEKIVKVLDAYIDHRSI